MNLFRGRMNWPIAKDWECVVCGHGPENLVWGIINGVCRCDNCHTEYSMRKDDGDINIIPICRLKPEYLVPSQLGIEIYRKPIDQWTDAEWNRAFEWAKNGEVLNV